MMSFHVTAAAELRLEDTELEHRKQKKSPRQGPTLVSHRKCKDWYVAYTFTGNTDNLPIFAFLVIYYSVLLVYY